MRRTILFITVPLLIAAVMCFTACRKNGSADSVGNEIVSKVNTWLNSHKSKDKPTVSSKIQVLQDNLVFSDARSEQFSAGEYFIIIPIKKSFTSVNNGGKDPVNNLLLFVNKEGNIYRGNIVQFIPKDRQKHPVVPVNTFPKYFTSQKLGCAGQFSFLNIVDQLLYQFKYDNGKFQSFGVTKSRQSNKGSANRENATQCFERYLVTTTYYPDGTVTVEEEYLYTFCVCVLGTPCDQLEGGSGEGGGDPCCIQDPNVQWSSTSASESLGYNCGIEGTDPITGVPIKTCTYSWVFNRNTLLWYEWKYISIETCYLEKIANVWKFKPNGVIHTGISMDGNPPDCVNFNCNVTSAIPSISADRKYAQMNLAYTTNFRISCCPWCTTKYSYLQGSAYWSAS